MGRGGGRRGGAILKCAVVGALASGFAGEGIGCGQRPDVCLWSRRTCQGRQEEVDKLLEGVCARGVFDEVGRFSDEALGLVCLRYAATADVCELLDKCDDRRLTESTWGLAHLLGFVRDPASIRWLRRRAGQEGYDAFLERWVIGWLHCVGITPYRAAATLDGEAEWSGFLRELYERDALSRSRLMRDGFGSSRLPLLLLLRGACHDRGTIEFFQRLGSADTPLLELGAAAGYLMEHGCPIGEERLRIAIERTRREGEDRSQLRAAELAPHGVFVPALLPHVGRSLDADGEVQKTLRSITFCHWLSGRREWDAWYAVHGSESRQTWACHAAERVEQLIALDPLLASKELAILARGSVDVSLLPWMGRWAVYRPLHDGVAFWVSQVYHPFWRDYLEPIAEFVLQESGGDLSHDAREALREVGFLPGAETSWCDYARERGRAWYTGGVYRAPRR